MGSEQQQRLVLVSQVDFDAPNPRAFPITNPTLDLSATSDEGGRHLLVCRPPGQNVSKIHQTAPRGRQAPQVSTVTWKSDGQFLAIGWSDGVVRLMGLENNKTAHHLDICPGTDSQITHVGWACNSIPGCSAPKTLGQQSSEASASSITIDMEERSLVSLPRELTFLEVETALPKLSPLPSGSAGSSEDAMVFTLRSGIDFLFRLPSSKDFDQVSIILVGTSDAKLHLGIHDSFMIGSFCCSSLGQSSHLQLVKHASHAQVSTHSLLLANTLSRPQTMFLTPMDLPFISSSPLNLSLLASKLTTLQNLMRYLKQAQLHMLVEWKNTRELPARFLRSVEGDLENLTYGPRNIVQALYHTVVTGHAHEPLREWLVDSLSERGHKRWDKAVTSGLQSLRNLVHENFLPVTERAFIILSRLRGLALFHDAREDIGFSVTQINRVMEVISCLRFVGHKILLSSMDELEHFQVFSSWLRLQIDRLASSTEGDELSEKEATMDNGKVLKYITHYLASGPLDTYFSDISPEDNQNSRTVAEDKHGLLDLLSKRLSNKNVLPALVALPNAGFLVELASEWSDRMFKDIAEAKKRSVRFGKPTSLSINRPIDQFDLTMTASPDSKSALVSTALSSKDAEHLVYLFHTQFDLVNGISSDQRTACCCIGLGPRKLIDLKFLGQRELCLLCSKEDDTPVIISIPLDSDQLLFLPYDGEVPSDVCQYMEGDGKEYHLPEEHMMKPVRMEAYDRSDARGEMPERICLLGSNRTTLRTFTLPVSKG